MPVLRNNGPRTPLGIAGHLIPPGGTAAVSHDAWTKLQASAIVKAWRKAGILMVEGEVPAPAPAGDRPETIGDAHFPFPPKADTDEPEKDALIASLAEFGIVKDRRSSVETLQLLLDEALR